MAQVLQTIPPSKSKRLGASPQVWKCANPRCSNLVSDVNQKTIPKKYCSDKCRTFMNYKTRSVCKPKTVMMCVVCGSSIAHKNSKARYCSNKCYWKPRLVGKKNCLICGKEFVLNGHGRRKYCSVSCNKAGRISTVIKKLGYIVEVKPIE